MLRCKNLLYPKRMDPGEANKPEGIALRRQCLLCPRSMDGFRLSRQPEPGSLMRGSLLAANKQGHCRKQNAVPIWECRLCLLFAIISLTDGLPKTYPVVAFERKLAPILPTSRYEFRGVRTTKCDMMP